MKNRWCQWIVCALMATAAGTPALADEADELRSLRDTTIALVNLLVQQGVLTREKADELIRKAEQAGQQHAAPAGTVAGAPPGAGAQAAAGAPRAAGATPAAGAAASAAAGAAAQGGSAAPPVVRVPYVPESVKQQIRDEVKQEVLAQAKEERWGEPGALPQWLGRISFAGDIRLRGQADRFPTDNVPNALPQQLQLPEFGAYNINNTSDPRNRLRLRVRFGAEARVSDSVTAGIRLTTGSTGQGGDPSTENENLGNYNTRATVGFDRAYITYRPTSWLYATGGRLGNPFLSPTTLVWGDDLSLQGVIVGVTPTFGSFRPFAVAGAFPIQDIEPTPLNSARSKWLYGYQSGLQWQMTEAASLKVAGALYDYRHLEGIPNPTLVSIQYNSTAAPFRQKGNSVFDIDALLNTVQGTQNYLIGLASKFREANASVSFDLTTFGTKHLVLDADWVRNIGFNHGEILARTGLDLRPLTTGTQERLTFGDTSFARRHAWQAYIGYRRVQSDAVVDAFTDADFHLGGTNATGYYLGGRYAFEPNSILQVRWFSAKQIDGLPLAIDVLQLDVIATF
ncbi:MAG TPA: putative porin [Steroidobacteraceae bacterium]|nr:putative porin [Steroidobacteraceae bacterium]